MVNALDGALGAAHPAAGASIDEDRSACPDTAFVTGSLPARAPLRCPADAGYVGSALLTLSDVMSTGHHAGAGVGVGEGDTGAVVGDGAVGLSAVLAANRPVR